MFCETSFLFIRMLIFVKISQTAAEIESERGRSKLCVVRNETNISFSCVLCKILRVLYTAYVLQNELECFGQRVL